MKRLIIGISSKIQDEVDDLCTRKNCSAGLYSSTSRESFGGPPDWAIKNGKSELSWLNCHLGNLG